MAIGQNQFLTLVFSQDFNGNEFYDNIKIEEASREIGIRYLSST